jgi:hypothetical protein
MMSDQQAASSSVDFGRVINDWADRERGAYLLGRSETHAACDRDRAAMIAALERAQQEIADLRTLCLKADSTLSLLRHRGGVRWGNPALPTESEVDQVIGSLRRAYESGQAQRGQG